MCGQAANFGVRGFGKRVLIRHRENLMIFFGFWVPVDPTQLCILAATGGVLLGWFARQVWTAPRRDASGRFTRKS